LAAASPERVTISFPGTDYRLILAVYQSPSTPVGKKINGSIRVQAKRVDVVRTGGKYIEPLDGTPRRIQGEVVASDTGENTLTVNAGVPIICKLTDARQRADQFRIGELVSFEVNPGASFTQALS
jgi:hypothetical protein